MADDIVGTPQGAQGSEISRLVQIKVRHNSGFQKRDLHLRVDSVYFTTFDMSDTDSLTLRHGILLAFFFSGTNFTAE